MTSTNDTPQISLGASVYFFAAQESASFSNTLVVSQGTMSKFSQFIAEQLETLYNEAEAALSYYADQINTKNDSTTNEKAQNTYNNAQGSYSHWEQDYQNTLNVGQSAVDQFTSAIEQLSSYFNDIVKGEADHEASLMANWSA